MAGKIENLGGVFIYANDSKKLAEWYQSHLGLIHETWGDSGVYYISFPYTDSDNAKRYFAWSIMPAKAELPIKKPKIFSINLRVSGMEDVVNKLETLGVKVKPMEVHDEGKFAWCEDLEGNHIELWEDVSPNK
jgi:predicted enzyme related to lactoylglutathione lyase